MYGRDVVAERHRHRYEFNNRYRTQLEDAGLVISAKSMDDLAGGNDRTARSSVVCRLSGPSRSFSRPHAMGTRCSSGSFGAARAYKQAEGSVTA
jgi:hypothetical protein